MKATGIYLDNKIFIFVSFLHHDVPRLGWGTLQYLTSKQGRVTIEVILESPGE
jgi:hypothetical protein